MLVLAFLLPLVASFWLSWRTGLGLALGCAVAYLNFFWLKRGVEGLAEGAGESGCDPAYPIAVTVLTSEADASAFDARLRAAIDAGCRGVVCSVREVERVHAARRDFVTIVPGVRFANESLHDQARVGSPADVARAGGDVLVLGRAVTGADDPRAAAELVYEAVRAVSA